MTRNNIITETAKQRRNLKKTKLDLGSKDALDYKEEEKSINDVWDKWTKNVKTHERTKLMVETWIDPANRFNIRFE